MTHESEKLTIGTFANGAGVNVETIRFYQRKGLLLTPERPYGGIRRYGKTDVARVKFVKAAQRLGFNLDEVAELLKLRTYNFWSVGALLHRRSRSTPDS